MVLSKLSSRLKRALGGSTIQAAASPEAEALAHRIRSFCPDHPESQEYLRIHLGRLIRSFELTPPGTAEDLLVELGCYMHITPLFPSLGYGAVRGAYLGPLGQSHVKTVKSNSGEEFTCPVDLFNAETDRFPYGDASVSTVVCLELIEHLAEDPMHTICEINRILDFDGNLVLSTPNISSTRSLAAMLHGYHPGLYNVFTVRKGGNAVEPKHMREYTPREISWMLEAAGFSVDHIETGPAYGCQPHADAPWIEAMLASRGLDTALRGDAIHAVGRKVAPVVDRYPSWLYE